MIAHVDADAFFASVLQRQHPHLKGKPLLALGMGGGCVIAASYEAKAKGVRTGMPLKEAHPLCPEAIAIPSDFLDACVASDQIETIIHSHAPIVEKMSVDEWYIDLGSLVGGVPDEPRAWAEDLQREVERNVSLTVSIGVAATKLLAKMSGEYRKPAGVTVIGDMSGALSIEAFLRDRPAAAIPGIGRKRQTHAEIHDWKTAWDIATAPTETLVHLFGKPGAEMQQELRGEPVFVVEEDSRPPQSISRCRSFRGTKDRHQVFGFVLQHATHCIAKMRRQNLSCRSVFVWLRDGTYRHDGRRRVLPQPLDTEEEIFPYIRSCFDRIFDPRTPVTQCGVCLADLCPTGAEQYSLFAETQETDHAETLQVSLDAVRERYGRDSITRGLGVGIRGKTKSKAPDMFGNIPIAT
jgi:DNA polymerase-4/DNA polymerase V